MSRGRKSAALKKKLVRDMRQSFMQFFAMMLLCALGTWVFAGLDANWRLQERTIETYLAQQELTDFWVRSAGFSSQDLKRIEAAEGVAFIQPRVTLELDAPEQPGEVTVAVHAFRGQPRLNIPIVRRGSLLADGDRRGCLLEEQFAQAQGLDIGDTLILDLYGQRRLFTVRGIVLSPEYLITTRDTTPEPAAYGFALMAAEAFPEFPFNDVLVRLKEGADQGAARRAVEAAVPGCLIITQGTHGVTVTCRSYITMFRNLSYLFPALAYFVAVLVVITTISRQMDTQRIQMGTLKALGFTNAQIRMHYISYALWPSLIGSALGLVLAQYTIPQIIWIMVTVNMRVPYVLMAPISPLSWFMAGAEIVLSVLICIRHINRAARESTAELLRPKPPRSGTRVLLERIRWLWQRFSFNTKMIWRNLMRNKGRTLMSMVGMLFCNMLIICSFGLQESIPWFTNDYYTGTLRYDVRMDLDTALSGTLDSYRNRLDAREVDGVMDVSVSLRAGETARTSLITVLPPDTTLLRLGQGHTLLELPESGLVLSDKLARLLGVTLGDRVEMSLTGQSDTVLLTVTSLAESNIGLSAYMSRSAWESLRKGDFRPTSLMAAGLGPAFARQLKDMDEVTNVKYPSEQNQQTLRIMDSASAAFSLLSGVALGLAFVICYNMGLLNFTERTREYATLKVLGYHQKEIRRLMLRENNLTAIFGVAAGIVPGVLLVQVILKMCEFESMVFVAHVSWPTILLSSLATFAFTWGIEWLLTRKVRGIDMVEALKSVE